MVPTEQSTLPKGKIAYLSSLFPAVRELFVIREVLALERAGLNVAVYSLKRPLSGVVHEELTRVQANPYYSPHLLSWAVGRDNLRAFLRAPLRYLSFPIARAWAVRAHPVQALKQLALFPKMVHYARHMKRNGVTGVNSCWASLPTLAAQVAFEFAGLPYCMTCRAWDIFVPMNQIGLSGKVATASVVRTNNDAGARFMRGYCPTPRDEQKIHRIYNPFDVTEIAPRQDPPPGGPFVIMSGGSLVEQKGLDDLLEAVALADRAGADCQVWLFGEGPLRPSLEQQADRLGIRNRVTLLGVLPNQDVLDRMRASHAFVLPSVPASDGFMDGIPNVLIESMSVGLPTVSTNISGIPELIEEGVSGLLVPPRDPDALAEAILRLINDPQLQRSLSATGRSKVESMFEMSRMASQLIGVYESAGLLG